MTINLDDLTYGQLKELARLAGPCAPKREEVVPLPFAVGDAILIRTVTMILLGKVIAIGHDFITLTDGGWVASTARFSETLAKGTLSEFERCDLPWFMVGRGAIVDVFPWAHTLPKVTK